MPETDHKVASLILAAGRGSRMKGFDGNKALLPLRPGKSPYKGTDPILLHIIESLPTGPKAIVVNHRKEDIMEATGDLGVEYFEQPVLNGTGGALLAARSFVETVSCSLILITMGDVPLVRSSTYVSLLNELGKNRLALLGFRAADSKQYGMLEIESGHLKGIVEWKYWKDFPEERKESLGICNAGIYAIRRKDLLSYLSVLAARPHKVAKEINGQMRQFEEYFITDLVGYMSRDGLPLGFFTVAHETEVMGIDDVWALDRAQKIFARGSF